MTEDKVIARVVIEMLGAPKEHIENTMQLYLEDLPQKHGIEILDKEIHPPKEQGRFFSTFAELDIKLKSIEELFLFCIDSMPSSIEIIEPDKITLDSGRFSSALNDLQAKLHKLDMSIKQSKAENKMISENMKKMMKNIIALSLSKGDKKVGELSTDVGVKEEVIKNFLEDMLKEKLINQEGDLYLLKKK